MSFELILPFLRPIEPLLLDESISEIMGNPDSTWWYERDGILCRDASIEFDAARLRTGLEVVANRLGKKLDEDNPLLNAQLPDGSRLAAVIPPVVRSTPAMVIRKFTSRQFTIEDLIARGTLTRPLAEFLATQIECGQTILISGGTGTGKTTLLNILGQSIPDHERIVVIEDTAELHIKKPNILPVECQTDTHRKPVTFDDLLKAALRWRPDRIILGEVRGIEARTLLDSFNTGHAGSLATIHANSAAKALRRFANLVLRSHSQATFEDVGAEIGEAVDLVIHVEREPGRRVIREVLRLHGYGRPFEQLQEAGMSTAKLDEIVRQKDPMLKSAVEMLAKGQVSAALESLHQQGRVKEVPSAEDRVRAIARSYAESPDKTLIVSPDNASRRELNVAVRQELKTNGILAPEDHIFRVLVQRQDMTGAERSWASHYEVKDVVRYARGSKAAGIEAGTYGSVIGVSSAANLLTVEKSSGELATYDPRRLTGVSVYREIDREFSVGDRIQFTAPDKSLGVANRDLAVIEIIAPDGRISTRLDNNRHVEFDAKEHRHFDHGYAVTSYSAQGLTAERVLVNADTGVHPDLLNSRFGYVSISRASHEAMLFTDDMTKLTPQLSTDVSKTSALGMDQGTSLLHGMGIG
jgi:Flp pilus assembly CpaF family ATPase